MLLGWEASWSENTCGEGDGVTRAVWASDSGDQLRAVCACLPLRVGVAVWGCCGDMLEEGGEINMGQSKGSRQEAWVLSGSPASLCRVCVLAPRRPTQRVRVTGWRGLAAARKLNLDRAAPWPCFCKGRV